ncbi:MAG TPA: sulfite oxidase-like oxidoreductase [Candidatus Polarisedimenticolaceae bacterium]|nr:sulfite oxidase-like oxidoreductase [Candidatus Polarisedimenticolaceae bacterium]
MDRIPPGQTETAKWPVLTYGETPRFDPDTWSFRCFGLVEDELRFGWEEFRALPQASVTCDIHCVTRWSRLDNRFTGVPVRALLERARPRPEAGYVLVHADPDYTTNLALDDLRGDDVLLALEHDGRQLEPDHGGPVRLVVPRFYFWKSAKWIRAFEFLDVNVPGFWEQNGYHLRADPWKEERYSGQETRAMQRMRAAARRRPR